MKRVVLAVVAALAVSGATSVMAQNVAVVNGKPIPSSRLEMIVSALKKQGEKDTPELRNRIREDLITREVLLQQAEKTPAVRSAEVQMEAEFARQAVLIRAMQQAYVDANPISDADMRTAYENIKKSQGDKEYRARHILVASEAEATQILSQLKAGGKFDDIAKAKSTDKGSGERGGDLDWAPAGQYVPEFSQAMVALKKGETSAAPVKSQFGFHIIRLDDVRDAQFPPFDQVKPQLEQNMKQSKAREYMANLRKNAVVR